MTPERTFHDHLASSFRTRGLSLVSAEFARRNIASGGTVPVWHVTIQHPARGVLSYAVALEQKADPYAALVVVQVVERVIAKQSSASK